MFTGIVTGLGTVRAITPQGAGADMRLVIATPWANTAEIPEGASIACSGCCLTAVALGPDWFAVDASADTHRLIVGAPGSGKTLALLHRTARLRERYHVPEGRYRVMVFTNVLKQYEKSGEAAPGPHGGLPKTDN